MHLITHIACAQMYILTINSLCHARRCSTYISELSYTPTAIHIIIALLAGIFFVHSKSSFPPMLSLPAIEIEGPLWKKTEKGPSKGLTNFAWSWHVLALELKVLGFDKLYNFAVLR